MSSTAPLSEWNTIEVIYWHFAFYLRFLIKMRQELQSIQLQDKRRLIITLSDQSPLKEGW